jgi:Ni/Co efflux regulator RcnB
MNKLLIASAIALASLASTSLPSQAASVQVITDGGSNYHRHNDNDHNDWDHHRHHRDCFTKRVVGWHHGHKVMTEQQVCR